MVTAPELTSGHSVSGPWKKPNFVSEFWRAITSEPLQLRGYPLGCTLLEWTPHYPPNLIHLQSKLTELLASIVGDFRFFFGRFDDVTVDDRRVRSIINFRSRISDTEGCKSLDIWRVFLIPAYYWSEKHSDPPPKKKKKKKKNCFPTTSELRSYLELPVTPPHSQWLEYLVSGNPHLL